MSGKVIALILLVVVALVGIPATLYLVKTQQDTQSHASSGDEFAALDNTVTNDTVSPTVGACTLPPQVSGVVVEYPSLDSGSADFTSGSCSWTAVTGATSYSVKITQKTSETDTGTVQSTQNVTATKLVFPVTANNYYQCDVSAINSCGTGPAGTFTLFCPAQNLTSPTLPPTVPPTIPPTLPPGDTPVPPQPTLPPTGNSVPSIAIGAASGVLVLIGGVLLLL